MFFFFLSLAHRCESGERDNIRKKHQPKPLPANSVSIVPKDEKIVQVCVGMCRLVLLIGFADWFLIHPYSFRPQILAGEIHEEVIEMKGPAGGTVAWSWQTFSYDINFTVTCFSPARPMVSHELVL